MANEISWRSSSTGLTDYATIRAHNSRTMWSTAATPNFETLTVANWANYAITLTETPSASYFFVGSWPTGTNMVVGWYDVDIYRRLGGAAAISDTFIGGYLAYWDGTSLLPQGADVRQLAGTAQTAGDIIPAIGGIGTAGGTAINQDCYTDDYVTGTLSGADGVMVSGTLTPTVSPTWTAHQLIGKGIRLGGSLWYLISDNTATACTVVSPPADATYAYVVGGIYGVTQAVTKVGTETGTFTNTSNVNSTYQIMTHAAQVVDLIYEFLTGGGTTPVQCTWTGYYQPGAGTLTFAAWRHDTGAWENLTTLGGAGGTTNVVKNITLYPRHAGTSAAELGKVYIRLYSNGDAHNHIVGTDQIMVSYSVTSRTVGYAEGAVWLDTLNGTAGTVSWVNGTADKPTNLLASALTIAEALGLHRIRVINGSTVTLTQALTRYSVIGHNWTLALGGQAVTSCYIEGGTVSGLSTGAGNYYYDCYIGTITSDTFTADRCRLTGTITLLASSISIMHDCVDDLPGSSLNPTIVFAANATLGNRNWRGGVNISTLVITNKLAMDGAGRMILGSDCSGGEITLRGSFDISDNVVGGFTGTLSDTARLNKQQVRDALAQLGPTVAVAANSVDDKIRAGVSVGGTHLA